MSDERGRMGWLNMPDAEPSEEGAPKSRGGSKFFVLGRGVWNQLWASETANRLNFVTTFLVLLAGTGADQRLSRWSASACEQYVGIGKPRARVAIQELINAKLVERSEGSTPLAPEYQLPSIEGEDDPIFLPVQLVTGFKHESSVLRRLREAGDPLALRMLIDLYGLLTTDVTFGVPLSNFRQGSDEDTSRKVCEMGVHTLWGVQYNSALNGSGDWIQPHYTKTKSSNGGWANFWERVKLLQKIGGLWFEPWLFESSALDAEPLFPIDLGARYTSSGEDEVTALSSLVNRVAEAMTEGREYLLESSGADIHLALPGHCQAPAFRGVAKLKIEADTPGARAAYGKRRSVVAKQLKAYRALLEDVANGKFDRPLGAAA